MFYLFQQPLTSSKKKKTRHFSRQMIGWNSFRDRSMAVRWVSCAWHRMWISTFLGSNVDTTSRDGWNGNGWILLTDVMMQKVEPPRNLAFHVFFLLARAGTNHFFFQVSCLGWYNRPLDVRKFFPWKNGLWKMIRLISWGPARWFLGEGCSKKNPKGLSSGLNSLVRRVWQTAVFFS